MHAELSPEHSQSSGETGLRVGLSIPGREKRKRNKTRSKREKQNVCLHLKKTASYFVLHLIIRLELLEQAKARDRWMGAMGGTPLSVPVYLGPFFRYEHGTADTPELSSLSTSSSDLPPSQSFRWKLPYFRSWYWVCSLWPVAKPLKSHYKRMFCAT